MDIKQTIGNKMPSQEHLSFINKLNDAKIPRQNQLIANRLFMKSFPRETTGAEIEHRFQIFGLVHDVKIIAKENTHFAFISFVNDNTALDVLRQHAIVPITFQNRPIILAPAYKKSGALSATNPSSYYSGNGTTMTPPPTPSRVAVNGILQQSSTPFRQQQPHQQPTSTPQTLYSPIFFPVQANMPFLPMTSGYLLSQSGPHPQLQPSFYPAFYTHSASHHVGGQIMNEHAYGPPPYMYSMGSPAISGQYQGTASANDASMTTEY